MESSEAANRRMQLLGRHLGASRGHVNEDEGASIVLLPCAASSNPVEFYVLRKDSRTLFARQSSEGGATFMRASTCTEIVQPCKVVPSETYPVRNSSEKITNARTNQGVDASDSSVPLFAKATSVGTFRSDTESARTHRPSPLHAKQPSPVAMVPSPTTKETLQDEAPPNFAKVAPLNNAKKETAWVPLMDVLESSSAYQVTMELPGVNPDSIRVEIIRKWLLVSGVRNSGDLPFDELKIPRGVRGIYHRREMVEGPYRARWRLPVDANTLAAAAIFLDGVLRIELPKSRSMRG